MSNKKKKKKGLSAGWVVLIVLLIVLIAAAAGVCFLFFRYYRLSNYRSDREVAAAATEQTVDPALLTESTGLTDSEIEEIQTAIIEDTETENKLELPDNKDLYNLLLIGVDRRDTSWNGNSDSMILVTLNKKTQTIHLTSFMRDLYADIPGIGVRKLNNAYAVGGGPLLIQTIEQNYKVNIDNYASVDFFSMAQIIDILGGVTLTVTEEEASLADGLIMDMCSLREGLNYQEHQFGSAGTFAADGLMAVGYARIRFTGNNDYERTERQRVVLMQIFDKVRSMNVTELNAVITKILPLVTHNIDTATVLSLLMQIPSLTGYNIIESRVPYDGLYTSRGEILVPDMAETISRLHEEIYNS